MHVEIHDYAVVKCIQEGNKKGNKKGKRNT